MDDSRFVERVRALAAAFPWPQQCPDVEIPTGYLGWFDGPPRQLLARDLSPRTRLVVELGAWLGMSTRFIADRAPNAIVVTIDHWRGSAEHRADPAAQLLLPRLYETFLAMCWAYRDRMIPVRQDTLEGMRTVAGHGLIPDLVYVDAGHEYEAVAADIELAHRLFPQAVLDGDDFDFPGVERATREFSRQHGLLLGVVGTSRRAWTLRTGRPAWSP